jgi:hypothetical protein
MFLQNFYSIKRIKRRSKNFILVRDKWKRHYVIIEAHEGKNAPNLYWEMAVGYI